MDLLNQLETFLLGEGYVARVGYMGPSPDSALAIYGSDVRDACDPAGSGVTIHVRGPAKRNHALTDALAVCRSLQRFEGALAPGGDYVTRVELVAGPANAGTDSQNRPFYSMALRVYHG